MAVCADCLLGGARGILLKSMEMISSEKDIRRSTVYLWCPGYEGKKMCAKLETLRQKRSPSANDLSLKQSCSL